MQRLKYILLVMLSLCVAPVLAQGGTCPAIVQSVLDNLDSTCAATGRNEACYGNLMMEAVARDGVTDFQFETVGDIEGVGDIQTMRLSALDTASEQWGVALMKLQANLPDTLPGQNITFLMFGDVEIANAVPVGSDARPMQAFYLKTGVSEPACAEAPSDGLLVQTPEGRGELTFSVNGVDMALGSTAFFRAPDGQQTVAAILEGAGGIQTANGIVPILAGTQITYDMDENFMPTGDLPSPEPYLPEALGGLPISLLERDFDPAPPLDPTQIGLITALMDNGIAPCEIAPFMPGCESLPSLLGGDLCPLNEAGEEDCSLDPYLSMFSGGFLTYQEAGGTPSDGGNDQELPPGCEPGICLADPAEACKCVLCGIQCPVETEEPASTSPVDCAADPTNPACQTNQQGGGQSNPPTDGGTAPTAVPPVVPTEVPPVEPTTDPGLCPDGSVPNPIFGCPQPPPGT